MLGHGAARAEGSLSEQSQIASAELKMPEVLVQCFWGSTRTQGSSGDPVIQRAGV